MSIKTIKKAKASKASPHPIHKDGTPLGLTQEAFEAAVGVTRGIALLRSETTERMSLGVLGQARIDLLVADSMKRSPDVTGPPQEPDATVPLLQQLLATAAEEQGEWLSRYTATLIRVLAKQMKEQERLGETAGSTPSDPAHPLQVTGQKAKPQADQVKKARPAIKNVTRKVETGPPPSRGRRKPSL